MYPSTLGRGLTRESSGHIGGASCGCRRGRAPGTRCTPPLRRTPHRRRRPPPPRAPAAPPPPPSSPSPAGVKRGSRGGSRRGSRRGQEGIKRGFKKGSRGSQDRRGSSGGQEGVKRGSRGGQEDTKAAPSMRPGAPDTTQRQPRVSDVMGTRCRTVEGSREGVKR
eukprot:292155-Prorocentrum_minimum.AAC.3